MNISYKRVDLSDLKLISGIEEKSFNRDFDKVLSIEEVEKSFEELSSIEGGMCLAYLGDDLLGYFCWKEVNGDLAEITDLAILPKQQQKGYGSRVLSHILDELSSYRKVKLVVHPKNTGALITYLKAGLVPDEIKKDYYDDGEDMLIMTKERVQL